MSSLFIIICHSKGLSAQHSCISQPLVTKGPIDRSSSTFAVQQSWQAEERLGKVLREAQEEAATSAESVGSLLATEGL